jgi:hypothetical protein
MGFPFCLFLPPSCSVSPRPIWAETRSDNLLVGPGTPRGRNADIYERCRSDSSHTCNDINDELAPSDGVDYEMVDSDAETYDPANPDTYEDYF